MTAPPLPPKEVRRLAIIDMARAEHGSDGKCEIDDNAKLSEGDDNGTYVQAWVWVDFSGTEFDKETEDGACPDCGEDGGTKCGAVSCPY